MSQANLYGFGRLAWNPDLSAQRIIDEWTRLTFGSDPKVVETINSIQLTSWRTFENYTGPLGLQTLTDIVGDHYGVAVEASERNGWGQWHNADEKGVGMERTVAKGTGYIGQYRPAVAKVYESLETCPDDLLLFLHHVPYTYKLHSGKTVIQYIYDSHYEGSEAVAGWVRNWKTLRGRIDDQRYNDVLAQLEYQAAHTEVWRDAVNDWFHRTSGIDDAKHRVGHHPGRIEAEAMKLEGYTVSDIKPWETASGGKAVTCPQAKCTAELRYDGAPGWYDAARPVLRPQRRGLAFPPLGGHSTRGRMERIRPLAGAQARFLLVHAPRRLRHRTAAGRRDPNRRRSRRPRTGGSRLPGNCPSRARQETPDSSIPIP